MSGVEVGRLPLALARERRSDECVGCLYSLILLGSERGVRSRSGRRDPRLCCVRAACRLRTLVLTTARIELLPSATDHNRLLLLLGHGLIPSAERLLVASKLLPLLEGRGSHGLLDKLLLGELLLKQGRLHLELHEVGSLLGLLLLELELVHRLLLCLLSVLRVRLVLLRMRVARSLLSLAKRG